MYTSVRRYEGVTDPSEVIRQVNEGFLPLISEIEGFVNSPSSMPEKVCCFRSASLSTSPVRRSRAGGLEST